MNNTLLVIGGTLCTIGYIQLYYQVNSMKKSICKQNETIQKHTHILSVIKDECLKSTSSNTVIQTYLKSIVNEKESYDVLLPSQTKN